MNSNGITSLPKWHKSTRHAAYTRHCQDAGKDWPQLWFDGSCQGNGTSQASGKWGWLLMFPDGEIVSQSRGICRHTTVTNNVAEWIGLRNGLLALPNVEIEAIEIRGDSALVIHLLSGEWGCKQPQMAICRDECLDALEVVGVKWSAKWVPREQNVLADALTR